MKLLNFLRKQKLIFQKAAQETLPISWYRSITYQHFFVQVCLALEKIGFFEEYTHQNSINMQKFSKTDRIIFLMIGVLLFAGAFFTQDKAYAYGECSEYGIWATYDYLSGGCKCMSGYVFGKDFLGQTT